MLFRGSSALAPNPNHDVRLDVLLEDAAEGEDEDEDEDDASSIFVLYTLYTPRFPLYSSGTGHDESELDVSVARARSYAARPPSHGGGASGAGLECPEPMVRAQVRRVGGRAASAVAKQKSPERASERARRGAFARGLKWYG